VNTEKISQITIKAGIATVERIVPITEAKKIKAQRMNPAINEKKINLKAALLALPEYFIAPKVRFNGPGSKAKLRAAGWARFPGPACVQCVNGKNLPALFRG
jgi:hypothetical protein